MWRSGQHRGKFPFQRFSDRYRQSGIWGGANVVPKQDIDKLWIPKREMQMRELVDEIGGPQVAASKLVNRGINPVEFAILQIGGVTKTAEAIGCSRQHFTKSLMRKPVGSWKTDYGVELAKASGVSLDLLRDAPPLIAPSPKKQAPPSKPSSKLKSKKTK